MKPSKISMWRNSIQRYSLNFKLSIAPQPWLPPQSFNSCRNLASRTSFLFIVTPNLIEDTTFHNHYPSQYRSLQDLKRILRSIPVHSSTSTVKVRQQAGNPFPSGNRELDIENRRSSPASIVTSTNRRFLVALVLPNNVNRAPEKGKNFPSRSNNNVSPIGFRLPASTLLGDAMIGCIAWTWSSYIP